MKMVNEKHKSISKHGKFSPRSHCVFNILFFVIGFSLAILVSSYFKTFPSLIKFDSTPYALSFSISSPLLSSSTLPPTPSSSLSPPPMQISLPPPPSSPLLLSSLPPPPEPLPSPLSSPPTMPTTPLVPTKPPSQSSPPTISPSPLPLPPPPTSPSTVPPSPPPILPISPPSPSLPPPMSISLMAVQIPSPSPSLPPLMPPLTPPNVKNNTVVSLMHNMTDEELFAKAINVSEVSLELEEDNRMVKKVAYMFLTHGALPLAPLWEKYFEGNEGLYSIYVHPHPSYNDSWPSSSVFFNRRIPSQPVTWGTDSMMAAEKRLLANSLLDISNQRFVLLSESCIPLISFKTTYDYLMNSNLSFVESYDNPKKPGRGRYNIQMSPYVNITHWRKGSQWFEVTRDLALKIVSDEKYYKLFQDYCLPPCYFDEHYIPTLLNILYPKLSTNRTITYVDWSRGGPHPAKFGWAQITDEFFNRIRHGSECVYNGKNTTICFMFARKFAPNALEPLLRISPLLLGFDP